MSYKSLLERATSKDESPPPAYIFREIAQLTHADPRVCGSIAGWLIDRLGRKEPVVKWKVLVTMKHVSQQSHVDLRRALQHHKDVVKSMESFSGKPDPLRGDEPFRKVRSAAHDALLAIFENTTVRGAMQDSRMGGVGSAGGGGTQWAGSAAAAVAAAPMPGGALHHGVSASGRMEGVGSSAPPPRGAPPSGGGGGSFLGAIKGAFTTAATPPATRSPGGFQAPSPRTAGAVPVHSPIVSPGGVGGGGGFGQASSRRRGQVGGVWGTGTAASAAAAGVSAARSPLGRGGGSGSGGGTPTGGGRMSATGGAKTDGSYERGLVEDLTARGGVRAKLDDRKLQAFLQAAQNLDVSLLAGLLDERLKHDDNTVITKALAVVERIARASAPGLAPLRTHLINNCDTILELYEEHDNQAVRKNAAKTILAMGIPGVVDEEALRKKPAAAPVPAAVPPEPVGGAPADGGDLLGLGGQGGPTPSATQGGADEGLGDIFAAMTLTPNATAAPDEFSFVKDMF